MNKGDVHWFSLIATTKDRTSRTIILIHFTTISVDFYHYFSRILVPQTSGPVQHGDSSPGEDTSMLRPGQVPEAKKPKAHGRRFPCFAAKFSVRRWKIGFATLRGSLILPMSCIPAWPFFFGGQPVPQSFSMFLNRHPQPKQDHDGCGGWNHMKLHTFGSIEWWMGVLNMSTVGL